MSTAAELEGRMYDSIADLIDALYQVDTVNKFRVVLDNMHHSRRLLRASLEDQHDALVDQ